MKLVVDSRSFDRQMKNLINYGLGFVDGVEMGKKDLLETVGSEIKSLLEQYVDSVARMNPDSLHHVYEWHQTGSPAGRLFDIEYKVTGSGLSLQSTFRQSLSVKKGSNVPFYNKARIMESGVSVTISPRTGDVLAFEDDGETVFTSKSVTVGSPGGSETTGSYEDTFRDFFSRYLSQSFLDVTNLRQHLSTPLAFKNNLAAGVSGGRPVGVRVGKAWMASKGSVA